MTCFDCGEDAVAFCLTSNSDAQYFNDELLYSEFAEWQFYCDGCAWGRHGKMHNGELVFQDETIISEMRV